MFCPCPFGGRGFSEKPGTLGRATTRRPIMAGQINATPHIKDTLDIICDLLGGVGVESFIVTFDGGGDDGQVEAPSEFKPEKAAKKAVALLDEVVKGARVSDGIRWSPSGQEQLWKEDPKLDDMIVGLCYDLLERVSSGWEINEGSHGIFHFDVKKRKVLLDFNERVIESNHFEYEL
jgi:hypothetical protein